MQGNNDTSVFNKVKLQKSKNYYNKFKFQSTPQADSTRISNYLIPFCNNDEKVITFTKKVAFGKEIKLKEFNFKVLHGILPRNLNLMRWKIIDSPECDVCGETQTIEHLLYSNCCVCAAFILNCRTRFWSRHQFQVHIRIRWTTLAWCYTCNNNTFFSYIQRLAIAIFTEQNSKVDHCIKLF